ncbi:MAG: SpoIVB peptidase S55 domain-containing protein [Phascolarctobacterium sp.]|nr:SpoIVB peptidase S55 domain-containing protein [Phascolarctobacterium sp.]
MRILFFTLVLMCQLMVAFANVSIMPVRDIQPGMHGVGKTVIQGDTIEDFYVEVIGVSGRETTGQSILVRLYGDLVEKTGGVAHGMSGSPVYIDGRLVGAVAFGRNFNDPHYCFLTPIGDMLRMLDEPRSVKENWIPKNTPLMASGFTPYGLEYLKEKLAPFGLDALPAGASDMDSSKPLEPGSSVGVSLMYGDMSIGALGTVTWVGDDGKILAFGHPFMSRGDSNFYMNNTWVLGCIPSLSSSYKVGNLGSPIGKIVEDRASGVAGEIGKAPKAIPLFVSATDNGRGLSQSIRTAIIEDDKLLTAMVDAATVNTVSKALNRAGGGTANVRFTIVGKDADKNQLKIERENMYYSADSVLKTITQELTDATNTLMQNKFADVDVYAINVEAEVSEDVKVAEITAVKALEDKVKLGSKLPIRVTLKPYRGAEFTKVYEYEISKDQHVGKLNLNVRGGSSMAWVIKLLRKQKDEDVPAAKTAEKKRTLKDYVEDVNGSDKNNELIVDISSGANSQAKNMEADAGLAGMLKGSKYKQKFPHNFIIDGEKDITVTVIK